MKRILLIPAFLIACVAGPCAGDEPDYSEMFAASICKAIRIIAKNHATPASEAQLAKWSIRGLFESVKEPIPKDIEKRLAKIDKAKSDEIHRLLYDARLHLGPRKELRKGHDVDKCLKALFANLEPGAQPGLRSGVVWAEEMPPCRIPMFGGLRGVGLKLEIDPATKYLRVVTPLFGGPAHKAGVRGGDIITHIRIDTDQGGKPLTKIDNQQKPYPKAQTFSTQGMTLDRAYDLLRGQQGTRVVVTVIAAKQSKKK